MKQKFFGFSVALSLSFLLLSYTVKKNGYTVEELRQLYGSGNPELWPKPFLFDEAKEGFQDIGVLPEMQFPQDNPYSKEKAELGKLLFFDPQLSESGKISCATCHRPEKGFADISSLSLGHNSQPGLRNTLTILNSGYAKAFFWDGKAISLEEQVKHPIENPVEMNFKMDLALHKIMNSAQYQELFDKAFGNKEITEEKFTKAIATYERTLVSPKSRFDIFVQGKKDEFTNAEIRGLHLFRTKANCINCHNTPYFSDSKFHNIGIDFFSENDSDSGRFEVTKNSEDKNKFKTPTLREISITAPYMHNGQFSELRNILMMYDAGMGQGSSGKSGMIKKLNLSDEEIFDLITFLKTLDGYKYSE